MEIVTQQEQKNKRFGVIISAIMHTLIIILFLLPFLTYPDPPPGQEGILVNLGIPDVGQGTDNAPPAQTTPERETKPEKQPEPVKEREVEKPSKPEPTPQRDVVRTEDPEAVRLREQQKREQAERDRRAREEAEARRKAAEEEARKKAEADKLKGEIGGLFGGTGSGKGNTSKPGNQGDPSGDPNAKNLEGVSSGRGDVGGGLEDRGVARRGPGVTDNSQSVGVAVIRVCVDAEGNVVSAEFTQRGSTVSDGNLKSKAIADARQWRFGKGSVDRQCGTITYNFRLQ